MGYLPCRQTGKFLFAGGQLTLVTANKALGRMMNCPHSSAQKRGETACGFSQGSDQVTQIRAAGKSDHCIYIWI